MSLHDYAFRIAGESDFPGIEKLFASRDIRRGWTTWKYLSNPDGLTRVFVAVGPGEKIVGTLAHMPRRFTSAGIGTLTVMQVVDIFVNAELRKQGVFLGLLDFARKHVEGARIGLPNDSSEGFGPRIGWRVIGPYETWRFPVLPGKSFAGKAMAFVAPVANALSRIYGFCWLPGNPRTLEMKRVTRFREDYALDPAVIHGIRSADYLNWRFVDNPEGNYCAYEFIEGDQSVGYCVFTQVGTSAILSDFVTLRHRRSCLRLLIDHCRERAIASVRFSGTGLRLGKLGFVHSWSQRNCTACEAPEGHWMITSCDFDSEPGRGRRGNQ